MFVGLRSAVLRAVAAFAVGVTLVSCGDGGEGLSDGVVVDAAEYAWPFGIDAPGGAEPVGRPAVYVPDAPDLADAAGPGEVLDAVLRITADDPGDVFHEWVDALSAAGITDVSVQSWEEAGEQPWLSASGTGATDGLRVSARVELWLADETPVLIVSVRRTPGPPYESPLSAAFDGTPPRPEPVDGETLVGGDVLFTEQGNTVLVPDGARSPLPALPTRSGSGGSTSVLLADDGAAAVESLLSQAEATTNGYYEVFGPEHQDYGDTTVVTVRFVITAGGWGFEAVSVRGPDDTAATVYVRSGAD